MSQSNLWSPTTGTVTGLNLCNNYNNALNSVVTLNSGSSAPTNALGGVAEEGQFWLDTSASPHKVKLYDGSQWVVVAVLDGTNHAWAPPIGGGSATLASATTTDLGSVAPAFVSVTGTTTITALGTTAANGILKVLKFAGILTLTHNGTSLILPTAANVVTAAGDMAFAIALGSGNWQVLAYTRADGSALSANANLTAALAMTGIISPTALTSGNNNDWNPSGLAGAETIRATPDAAGSTLTGLAGGSTGRQITVENVGTTALLVAAQDTNSSAANRFALAFPTTIYPDQAQTFRYDATSSRWRMVSTLQHPPIFGFANLKIVNDSGAPTTTMDVTADSLTVADANGNGIRLRTVSVAPVMTSSGANGLDTGSIVNNTITWYAVHVIFNPTTRTVAGLYSLSATAPTLPAGYTMWARVGWVRTDGAATARWMRQIQYGRRAQYVVTAATNTLLPPVIGSGVAGTFSSSSPVLANASVSNFVPPTAAEIIVAATSRWEGASSSGGMLVAPNTGWGGTNNGPLGTNGVVWPIFIEDSGTAVSETAALVLESTNIAWASFRAGGAIACLGWIDNL